MTLRLFGLALLVLGSAPCRAADPCETQDTTLEINACAQQRFDAQDRLLNRSYRSLLEQLPATQARGVPGESPRALLVKAQRRWIEFRNADCKARAQPHAGGTIYTAVLLGCMQQRTEQRNRELAATEWQDGQAPEQDRPSSPRRRP